MPRAFLSPSLRALSREPAVNWMIALTLLAKAYLIYHHGSQLRSLLWDESLIRPLLESFSSITPSISWHDYHHGSDAALRTLTHLCATLLCLTALPFLVTGLFSASFHTQRFWKKTHTYLLPLALILLFTDIAAHAIYSRQLGFFLEHSLLLITPLTVLFYQKHRSLLTLACALTFLGHGLYACGYYPIPRHFLSMTLQLTPLSEANATLLLTVIGFLDLLAAAAIFFAPLRRLALSYMLVWGSLTALARFFYYIDTTLPRTNLPLALTETLVRSPHWWIPLLLIAHISSFRLQTRNLLYKLPLKG